MYVAHIMFLLVSDTLNSQMVRTFSSFRFQFKCHLFHEAFSDHPAQAATSHTYTHLTTLTLTLFHYLVSSLLWSGMLFTGLLSPFFIGIGPLHPQCLSKSWIDVQWIINCREVIFQKARKVVLDKIMETHKHTHILDAQGKNSIKCTF